MTLPSTAPAAQRGTTTSRPRLGFAGVGWIGRHRLRAIAETGLAEIAAIYDPSADCAREALAHGRSAAVTTSFEELLTTELDGIVIATPSALHAEQSIAALERGLAVFCQKPLGRSHAEIARVIDIARRQDRLLQVDLSYRFAAGVRAIRELISSDELGEVYAIEAVFHNAYGPDKAWFYDPQLSGGGCLLDLGIHLVDLALWSLDFPVVQNVSGHLLHRGRPLRDPTAQAEDYAAAQFVTSAGTSVQLACSWKAPAGADALIRIHWLGTKGGALFQNVGGSFYDFTAEHLLPDRSRRVLAQPPDTWGGRAAVAWAQQLARSAAFDHSIAHLETVARILDQIYGRTS